MRWRSVVSVAVLLVQTLTLAALMPGAAGASSGGVVISQLQTAGAVKSTDEFIELSNSGAGSVSLSGWSIQYRAASATNGSDCTKGWTTKTTVTSGSIAAGSHYLFAPSMFLAADGSFSAGLASVGTVRLLDPTKTTVNALAWGAATCGQGSAAAAPAASQSLERRSDTGSNAADFVVQPSPVAHGASADFPMVAAVTPSPGTPAVSDTSAVPAVGSGGTPALHLTELMVDPAAPQSDAQDEFVEVHNAGDSPIDATGYAVKTGSHITKLPAGFIPAGGYVVLTSADTTISLANTGGVANLLNPAGEVVDTAGAWGAAVAGASWAYFDGTWRWTQIPTPGESNDYEAVPGTAGAEGSGDYPEVQLTELLPDPAAPLTDAADEFIEIYNPNSVAVDLSGYVIKAGHDLGSKYVIKSLTVPAGGYGVVKSSTSKLALANTGSSVALYTPDGAQLGSTVTYAKAPTGASWANVDGAWAWTAEPTPGAVNVLASVEAAAAQALAAKAAKAKASPKAKAAAKTKAAAKAKASKSPAKPLVAGSTSTGGRWLLFILAGLTIGYIIYEFRYDLRNYYYKLRGYPSSRPATVTAALGRGVHRVDQ